MHLHHDAGSLKERRGECVGNAKSILYSAITVGRGVNEE